MRESLKLKKTLSRLAALRSPELQLKFNIKKEGSGLCMWVYIFDIFYCLNLQSAWSHPRWMIYGTGLNTFHIVGIAFLVLSALRASTYSVPLITWRKLFL